MKNRFSRVVEINPKKYAEVSEVPGGVRIAWSIVRAQNGDSVSSTAQLVVERETAFIIQELLTEWKESVGERKEGE